MLFPPTDYRWYTPLLDLLLPAKCHLCAHHAAPGHALCADCLGAFYPLAPQCLICGRPEAFDGVICEDCLDTPPPYRSARSAFWYEGAVQKSIAALKYRGIASLGKTLGLGAAHLLAPHLSALQSTVIVPTPTTRQRRIQRGYNQCDILAEALSTALDLPIVKALKRRPSQSQVGKSQEERFENALANYELKAEALALEGESILFIDDVRTTGATLRACASLLHGAHPKFIDVLTIAYTPQGKPDRVNT